MVMVVVVDDTDFTVIDLYIYGGKPAQSSNYVLGLVQSSKLRTWFGAIGKHGWDILLLDYTVHGRISVYHCYHLLLVLLFGFGSLLVGMHSHIECVDRQSSIVSGWFQGPFGLLLSNCLVPSARPMF